MELINPLIQFLYHYSSAIIGVGVTLFILSVIMTILSDKGVKEDSNGCVKDQPQPRWEVLKIMNHFILALFVGSVAFSVVKYRGHNVSEEHNNTRTILYLGMIWSICLAYFFGFFGISFLDKSTIFRSPSAYGLSGLAPSNNDFSKEGESNVKKTKPTFVEKSTPKKVEANNISAIDDLKNMSDEEVANLVLSGEIKDHTLEKQLADCERAVAVRRKVMESKIGIPISKLPYKGYDYDKVFGCNCEIVIGYLPIPVGLAGPMLIDGERVFIPMATTEGCLVASTNRGCKAISEAGGARSVLMKDGITRAPCILMPSATEAAAVRAWVEQSENFQQLKSAFESTTSFGKLKEVKAIVAGRNVFLRFSAFSGDAMGMNMISKGCLKAIEVIREAFPQMELIALSGNVCTDKKPSAINWIEGRGKSVVVEAFIPSSVVTNTLKTSISAMVEANRQKNLIGSAMAGSIGGFNAHASNIVTAIFLATGQDPAQNVESSNCITLMEEIDNQLYISCTMPSIEVGTVGGGTHLPAQSQCLDIMKVKGAGSVPGANAQRLAQIIAAGVLAGELSLMAALAANHLVKSHMEHNRKKSCTNSNDGACMPNK